jgi:hypothetical protein
MWSSPKQLKQTPSKSASTLPGVLEGLSFCARGSGSFFFGFFFFRLRETICQPPSSS